MHAKNIIEAGKKTGEAGRALIMVHGRGASAEDILSLADHLDVKDYSLIAPQATNHSWYPYSFLEQPSKNEPWLSSALSLLGEVTLDMEKILGSENVYFLGFSQGACLALEFVARNAKRYGGVVAFTGGLIGDKLYMENYKGDFNGCPVFIGTSDPDPHVPVARVHETKGILESLHATVTEKVYKNMGHTIIQEEINYANGLVLNRKQTA